MERSGLKVSVFEDGNEEVSLWVSQKTLNGMLESLGKVAGPALAPLAGNMLGFMASFNPGSAPDIAMAPTGPKKSVPDAAAAVDAIVKKNKVGDIAGCISDLAALAVTCDEESAKALRAEAEKRGWFPAVARK